MTVLSPWDRLSGLKGLINQILILVLINIPTISFGLAFGWVSLVSGEDGSEGEGSKEAVVAAVTTFVASLAGVPLSAWFLGTGRKFAIIATSFLFVICWSLKLGSSWLGVWSVICARMSAGLGGASAWALAPLLAREMCSDKYRGAAVSALPLAHNVGVLLMYLAADSSLPHSTILWLCLSISLVHCAVSLFMPESPSFLAAQGKPKEACKSLAWLRGVSPEEPSLQEELATLPMPEPYERSPFMLAKEMLEDRRRRRAFIIGTIAIVGQEMCGILAIMQYAERVFLLAGGEPITSGAASRNDSVAINVGDQLASPTREAVMLGAVQFIFSAIALYLVERIGRRTLLIWCATLTGGALAVSGALVRSGNPRWTAVTLAFAVATDAAGLQPAPYALLADMFHYEYRGCALMLATVGACAGNALESALFPAVVAVGGLTSALLLGGGMTLVYALFAAWAVPETKGRSPEQIYELLCSNNIEDDENNVKANKNEKETIINILHQQNEIHGKIILRTEIDKQINTNDEKKNEEKNNKEENLMKTANKLNDKLQTNVPYPEENEQHLKNSSKPDAPNKNENLKEHSSNISETDNVIKIDRFDKVFLCEANTEDDTKKMSSDKNIDVNNKQTDNCDKIQCNNVNCEQCDEETDTRL